LQIRVVSDFVTTKAAFSSTQWHGLLAAAFDDVRDAMLPGWHSLRDGPQRSVSGLRPTQVRAPAALEPGSTEICPLQPDNDDVVGPLQAS
jgi:hypothetical protein